MGAELFSSGVCGRPAVSAAVVCARGEIESEKEGSRVGGRYEYGLNVVGVPSGIFGFQGSKFEEASINFDLSHFCEIGDFIDVTPMRQEVVHQKEILNLFELDGEESDPPMTVFGL